MEKIWLRVAVWVASDVLFLWLLAWIQNWDVMNCELSQLYDRFLPWALSSQAQEEQPSSKAIQFPMTLIWYFDSSSQGSSLLNFSKHLIVKFSADLHLHHLLRSVHFKDSSGFCAMKSSALAIAVESQYLCPHSKSPAYLSHTSNYLLGLVNYCLNLTSPKFW